MSFREVTELRKAGQLTQAYNMALTDLNTFHSDVWSCRAMFWVLYDMSKQLVVQQRFDNIANFLKQFNWIYERLRGLGEADEVTQRSFNSLKSNIATALLQSGKTKETVIDIFSQAGFFSDAEFNI